MRLQKYLAERWIHSYKDQRGGIKAGQEIFVEVFVNPTKGEFKDAAGSTTWDRIRGQFVRFFADMKKKKVYIWHPESIHSAAWKQIGDGRSVADETILAGAAKLERGKWRMADSDSGVSRNLYKYRPEDWEWANKWIDVTSYLEEWQEKFERFD
jgi:hypothetical protein